MQKMDGGKSLGMRLHRWLAWSAGVTCDYQRVVSFPGHLSIFLTAYLTFEPHREGEKAWYNSYVIKLQGGPDFSNYGNVPTRW